MLTFFVLQLRHRYEPEEMEEERRRWEEEFE